MKSGQEYDALTTAKRYFSWKPGQRKQIKRAYNKRFRKQAKSKLEENDYER